MSLRNYATAGLLFLAGCASQGTELKTATNSTNMMNNSSASSLTTTLYDDLTTRSFLRDLFEMFEFRRQKESIPGLIGMLYASDDLELEEVLDRHFDIYGGYDPQKSYIIDYYYYDENNENSVCYIIREDLEAINN